MALPSSPLEEMPTPLEIRKRVGNNVRTVMRHRRVHGRQLAELLALNEGSISERLSGKTPFKIDELELVARFLRVDVGLLYAEPDALFRTGSFSTVEDHGQMVLSLGHEGAPALELIPT